MPARPGPSVAVDGGELSWQLTQRLSKTFLPGLVDSSAARADAHAIARSGSASDRR
jgi:hypothetical protein